MDHLHELRGWKGLDLDNPAYQRIRDDNSKKGERIAKLIHRVFTTDDGRELLEHFSKQLLMKPVMPPGGPEGMGYFREGQNDLIRQILQQIELAEKIE